MEGMHHSSSALTAEVERGRARRAGQVDDFPSLVHDVIIHVMAQECAALPDVSAMADPNGNPLPGFARMARADYERRGGTGLSPRTGSPRRLWCWSRTSARVMCPGRMTPIGSHPSPQARKAVRPLHAHEITPVDAALIRMMAGAHFGDGATVALPSGKTITGTEMRRWVQTQD